jgi:hypothetical protein
MEEGEPLIRTSTQELARERAPIWNSATAADYTHYVNPTITTCNASTGVAYTAANLGLTNSTQA